MFHKKLLISLFVGLLTIANAQLIAENGPGSHISNGHVVVVVKP
ncbi:MAG: hypothetical protein WA432_04685 [Candidatus Babeliaceae bacterium]